VEKSMHLHCCVQMPLCIAAQETPSRIESLAMAYASKDVEHFALIRSAIADTTRRQKRQVQRTRNANRRTVAMLFFAVEVALQLDVDVARTEKIYQFLYALMCGVVTAAS